MGFKFLQDPEHKQQPGQAFEGKLLRLAIFISLGGHGLCFCLQAFNWWPAAPIKLAPLAGQEWLIEAEIAEELATRVVTKPEVKEPVSEPVVEEKKEMLPQLPKTFSVQEPEPPSPPEEPELVEKPKEEPKVAEVKPEPKKPAEPKEAEKVPPLKIAMQKKEADNRLHILDALERLRKEQERQLKLEKKKQSQQEKVDKEEKQKIAALLDKRMQEIKGLRSGQGGPEVDHNHPYVGLVQRRIKQFYALPEVYRMAQAEKPILNLLIDKSGAIERLSLEQSSHNEALDQLAFKAVREAAPFPSPPRELWGLALQIQFDPSSM